MLQHLAPTRKTDRIMLSLYRMARARRRSGWADAVIAWRPATACCRWPVRTAAYAIYRPHGQDCGFFLEYDCGTATCA